MMKIFHLKLVSATIIIIFCIFSPVKGQGGGFTISGADATNTLNAESSSTLSDLIDQIDPRIVIEFANANTFIPLEETPEDLSILMDNMNPRIVYEFANASQQLNYGFPKGLIGDGTPPQITNIGISPAGENSASISWTTDELADSEVQCGTISGTYTVTVYDSLYVMNHSLLISGLAPGVEYFCVITSIDMSDNPAVSNEFSFIQAETTYLYLPMIVK